MKLFHPLPSSHNIATLLIFVLLPVVTKGADDSNTLNGNNAGKRLTSGIDNSAFGKSSLQKATTASNNTAIGSEALGNNVTGNLNVALGDGALSKNETGTGNVALGADAGISLKKGNDNIYIGSPGKNGESGKIRIGTTGVQNSTFLTGVIHGNGSGLTSIRASGLAPNSVTSAKLAKGSVTSGKLAPGLTLAGITAGAFKGNLIGHASTATTAVDFSGALAGDVSGKQGTTVVEAVGGLDADVVAAGIKLVNEATSIANADTIVRRDTSGGMFVSALNLTHTSNRDHGVLTMAGDPFLHSYGYDVFIGKNSGNFSMTGSGNTACGNSSLNLNTKGIRNTAMGMAALRTNSTGSYNTATGEQALYSSSTGSENTADGSNALNCNTIGSGNTALGSSALLLSIEGSQNTATGYRALLSVTTGGNNTAIGANTDVSSGELSNATAIGANAKVDASNKVRIGDKKVTVIEGQVAFTFSSDQTKKEKFEPVDSDAVLEKVRKLPVTTWNYIGQDPTKFRHYGPMAQDFYSAFGRDSHGTVGTPTTINIGDVAGVQFSAIQALAAENEILKQKLAKQEARGQELEDRLARVERRLSPAPAVAEVK